jgi:hypothetical protein
LPNTCKPCIQSTASWGRGGKREEEEERGREGGREGIKHWKLQSERSI